ncbi:sialidase family protein [Vreelandella populi]|uniref:Exo-alpha-sialidase n=1 Tax=Vreelandella populi TaxID=2498858 RepID=A0A433LFV0_9GAMM|nr:sialidase family protein [Halomonas populi]RUR48786.1 exo-alpha-sialidase [Halomonas populi]
MPRNNTGNPLPSASPLDRQDNSLIFDELVNSSSKSEVPDRFGKALKTWHAIQRAFEDLLIAGGRIFDSEADGRAAVGDRAYFYTVSSDPNVSRELWQRVNENESELIARDPSVELIFSAFFSETGFSWDSSSGTSTIEVSQDNPDALLIATFLSELLKIDSRSETVSVPSLYAPDSSFDLTQSSHRTELSGRHKHCTQIGSNLFFEIDPEREQLNTNLEINHIDLYVPDNFPVPDLPEWLPSEMLESYSIQHRQMQGTPTIADSNGVLWCSWRADFREGENGGNFIVLAKSVDSGDSWVETGIIAYPDTDAYQMVDPMLWLDPDGVLWLWWSTLRQPAHTAGANGMWAVTCKNPSAEFNSWTTPFLMSHFGDARHPCRVNEQWWLPMDTWALGRKQLYYPETGGLRIVRIHHNERRVSQVVKVPDDNAGGSGDFYESELQQTQDGRLLLLQRAQGVGITYRYSGDDGQTWTAAAPFSDVIGSPTSTTRSWLGTSSSGRLMLCYNKSAGRRSLTIALSEDSGETWPHEAALTLNSDYSSTYPVISISGDDIFVVFDQLRSPNGRILFCKLKESEIINGTAPAAPFFSVISEITTPEPRS